MANKDNKNRLGSFLKSLRENLGYSQEKVAEMLHVERSGYSHYETDKTIPPVSVIHELAKIFKVPAASLFILTSDEEDLPPDYYYIEAEAMVEFEKNIGPNTPYKNLSYENRKLLFYVNTLLSKKEQEELAEFFAIKFKNSLDR